MSDEAPAVARRRLRLALRRMREHSNLTQGDVARALEWSLSKVNRIEIGDVTVSNTDLQALLRLFEVDDDELVEKLAGHCRSARRRGWWDNARYGSFLTPATAELLQFESEASRIYSFHSALFPGLVQTRSYAEQVFSFYAAELSELEREARLSVRMGWRSHIFDRPDPPRCFLVLDESILGREVSGPHVMIEQLRELLRAGREPNIEVRILPLSETANLAAVAPFVFVELDEQDAVLYRETHMADQLIDTPAVVKRYQQVIERVLDTALGVDASARLIEARIAALLSSLDRR